MHHEPLNFTFTPTTVFTAKHFSAVTLSLIEDQMEIFIFRLECLLRKTKAEENQLCIFTFHTL